MSQAKGGGGAGAAMATPELQSESPTLRGIFRVAENRRVLISVIPTLTLAIIGG